MPSDNCSEYDWVDDELPKVKTFFRKISKILVAFADSHNLLIEKYYHSIPGWEFLFKHPAGGICSIEVLTREGGNVTIGANWSLYDYEQGLGYDKHTERISSSINAETLAENLETNFQIAMAWTREDLILTSKRGAEYPVEKTKEEVEREMARYPVPRR